MTIASTAVIDQTSIWLFSWISAAAFGLVGLCSVGKFPLKWVFELLWVRYVGKISYGIYLLHMCVVLAARHLFPRVADTCLFCVSIEFPAILIVASISWCFFESRIIAWGKAIVRGNSA
jgi:peptidoglycan/LPS O-acetylase OafA/YrhL